MPHETDAHDLQLQAPLQKSKKSQIVQPSERGQLGNLDGL